MIHQPTIIKNTLKNKGFLGNISKAINSTIDAKSVG